jgi:dolichol-phosphate mannosyltransferase
MISFVIPTINEEVNIFKTLDLLLKLKNKISFDVTIVDDNSNDKTIAVATSFKKKIDIKIINNRHRKGLGFALMLGFKKAKGKHVIFLDADRSISLKDINKIIDLRIVNGIVIGNRYLKKSKIYGNSKSKIFFSKYLNIIVSKFFNIPVIDMSHSFRIISKNINIKSLNLTHPGFFWELTINAYKSGFAIKEFPVTFYDREHGKTKNSIFKMMKSILISVKNLI